MKLNDDFVDRFTERLIELIMDISLVDGQTEDGRRVAMIQAAEMIETFVTFIAILSRDSAMTQTPKLTREWTDRLARRLRARIAEAKNGPTIFDTISPGWAS